MEKRIVKSKDYTWVECRCDRCRNYFGRSVKKEAGSVRLTCSDCGNTINIYV